MRRHYPIEEWHAAWEPPQSLFAKSIAIKHASMADNELTDKMFFPEYYCEDEDEERRAVLACDLYIAVGVWHLRGPQFTQSCWDVAEHILASMPEGTEDLRKCLLVAKDEALRHPWSVRSDCGREYDYDTRCYYLTPSGLKDRARREFYLRELLAMARGRRHIPFHWMEDEGKLEVAANRYAHAGDAI